MAHNFKVGDVVYRTGAPSFYGSWGSLETDVRDSVPWTVIQIHPEHLEVDAKGRMFSRGYYVAFNEVSLKPPKRPEPWIMTTK